MLSSFVIVAVNVFLTTVAKKLSRYQRFYTQSEFEAALMLKLTVVHVINSIIVPAASTRVRAHRNTAGECLWYAPGGLIEGAFYLQLFNAFLPNVIALADIGGRFKRRVLSRYAQTQEMMDLAMEPPNSSSPRSTPLCARRWRWQWFTARAPNELHPRDHRSVHRVLL